MPYSYPDNVPQFAVKQTAAVKKVVVRVFNETFNKTNSEQKARQAALAAMVNAREAEAKKATMKAADEVLKQALYVVLVPDEVDAHGDTYSVDTVRKAKESFNKSNPSSNLFHLVNTDAFSVIESYTLPADAIIADELIKEGTWLMKLQFNDDNLFADVLAGKYSGVSIGAMAEVKNLE